MALHAHRTRRCDPGNGLDVEPFCKSLAWLWVACPCAWSPCPPPAPAMWPCSRCGCGRVHHDEDPSACALFRSDVGTHPEHTDLSTIASCLDVCTCGTCAGDAPPFYVSVIDDERKRKALLLGPYVTHSFALSMVPTGRRLAERVDARAVWYAFGTAHGGDGRTGILNDMLDAEERETDREAEQQPKMRAKRKAVAS